VEGVKQREKPKDKPPINQEGTRMKKITTTRRVPTRMIGLPDNNHPGGKNTPLEETKKCIKMKKNSSFISFSIFLMRLFIFENRLNKDAEVIL
jgi:hypothetical protein